MLSAKYAAVWSFRLEVSAPQNSGLSTALKRASMAPSRPVAPETPTVIALPWARTPPAARVSPGLRAGGQRERQRRGGGDREGATQPRGGAGEDEGQERSLFGNGETLLGSAIDQHR